MEHGPKEINRTVVPICKCEEEGRLSEQFDAFYCPISGEWLEIKCHDEECKFCANRPDVLKI